MTRENHFIVMSDFNGSGIEWYSTAGIAKLANGNDE